MMNALYLTNSFCAIRLRKNGHNNGAKRPQSAPAKGTITVEKMMMKMEGK